MIYQMDTVHVEQAITEAALAEVASIWTRSSHRLHSLGFDQWQYPVKWENIRRSAAERALWLVRDSHHHTVGTITVEQNADPYWLPEDRPKDAVYIHRMIVDDGYRGSELGSALLDWVARQARQQKKSWVRLDAWKSNPGLHQYYLNRGFILVRIDDNPEDPSGACFQRPSSIELHRGPKVIDARDP